ncbi:oligosaccharide flippase family protein [[Micrococcus luteus] ATCC 49442]|uniref:lipopolysaccharide biosynthesis protein n=1 Tax=[Micrococcus luteus] ATCC 49442 TaxID=2698727 RepID=UPI0013D9986C
MSKNSFIQASGTNFLILGLTLVAGVVVARSLGAEGRGHYAAIMAWFGLTLVLGELGQSGAVTYYVSRHGRWGADFVRSSQILMSIAGVLAATGGVLAADLLAGGDDGLAAAYRVSFVGCLINGLGAPYVYALQAVSIRSWNFIRVIQPAAYLLLMLAVAWIGQMSLLSLALILVTSTSVQMLWAGYVSARFGIAGGRSRSRLRRPLLKYGLAYSGSSVPLAASSQIDKLALSRMVSPSDLGLYAIASTIASMASPFSTAISSVIFPRIARRDIGHERKVSLENRSLALTVCVSLVVSVLVAATAPWTVPWIFGDEFVGAVSLTWWLVPAMVLRGCSQVVSAHLRGRGRPGSVSWAQCGGLLCAIVGILTLTPMYGMAGTALGIALSELLVIGWTYGVLRNARRHDGNGGPSQMGPKHSKQRRKATSQGDR